MFKLLILVSVLSVGMCMPGGYSEVTDDGELSRFTTMFKEAQSQGTLAVQQDEIQQIKSIETQVVAGLNIRYTLVMKDGKICTIVIFDQPWTKTRIVHDKVCKSQRALAGGYSTQTDKEAIRNYTLLLAKVEASEQLGLDQYSVQKVETQVVAGINIRYTLMINGAICHIVVFEQVWTSTRKVSHNDCQRKPRRQLFGGYSNIDVNDVMAQKCLSLSVDYINRMSNNMIRQVESNVMSAKQQVVAGMNYVLTFQTAQSTCRNLGDMMGKMAKDCPVDSNSEMSPTTWKTVCYNDLSGKMTITKADEIEESKESNPDIQLDNDLKLDLKPISSVKTSIALSKTNVKGKVKDMIKMGKGLLRDHDQHVVSLLRKKRNINFLIEKLQNHLGSSEDIDKIVEKGKALLGGGDDHDVVNHIKDLIGQDGHDFIKHGQKVLGGDGHDLVNHVEKYLGGDEHDLVPHSAKLLGGDDHDLENHGQKILGGDDHDLVNHGQKILGGDDHDLVNHGQKILGGDDHDLVNHGQKILGGGDDHDLVNHGQKLLGGDEHDLIPHGKKILGGDDHDLVNHGQKILGGGDDHDLVNHGQKILGGDDHDLFNHGQKLLGGDDHVLVNHGQKLLGGDEHDLIPHGKKILGGDKHDLIPHGKKILGGDGHDLIPHGKKILGGDDHDMKTHGKQNKTKILGGDGHDYCHKGMFLEFKAKFNKLYGSDKEEEKRYYTFCENMRTAWKLQETEGGTAVYGATKFADLTKEEFQQYVGKKWDLNANLGMKKAAIPRGKAPDSFDWRDHGAVTPVKNQGSCGSCWAFSTTGNIEGQWAVKKNKLISLSEQELVDCDKVDEGCNGGLPSQAYKEIERLGGLETESDYSYKGEDEKCIFNKTDVRVYINDSVSVSSDETEMTSWLAANGPISIGINAFAMQFYMGGISHPWKIFCNPKNLDHGVLIVGYGVQDDKPYWIVKNSWGPDWGEKGYYLVYRGAGVCGLNTMCTSAVVD